MWCCFQKNLSLSPSPQESSTELSVFTFGSGHSEPSYSILFQVFLSLQRECEHWTCKYNQKFRTESSEIAFPFLFFLPSFYAFPLYPLKPCAVFSLSIWLSFLLVFCNTGSSCVMRWARLRFPAAHMQKKFGGLEEDSSFSVIFFIPVHIISLEHAFFYTPVLHGDKNSPLYPRGVTYWHVDFSIAWSLNNLLWISENQLALV